LAEMICEWHEHLAARVERWAHRALPAGSVGRRTIWESVPVLRDKSEEPERRADFSVPTTLGSDGETSLKMWRFR
jgi:hypothetical protein